MHGCACKQYIFCSCNIYFQCCAFRWKSFHVPVQKRRRQKQLRVSNVALLLVIFKWHHGSEGVKREQKRNQWNEISAVICAPLPFMYCCRFHLSLVFVLASVCGICHSSEVFILMFWAKGCFCWYYLCRDWFCVFDLRKGLHIVLVTRGLKYLHLLINDRIWSSWSGPRRLTGS